MNDRRTSSYICADPVPDSIRAATFVKLGLLATQYEGGQSPPMLRALAENVERLRVALSHR